MTERKLKVFLCHASEDKPAVKDLYRKLNAEGWIDAWLDAKKLKAGQEWNREIENAIDECHVVLACISSTSVDKEGYVQKELRAFLRLAQEKAEGTIFIIPLKLDKCQVPDPLQSWQWVDYFPGSQRGRAYQRLLEGLRLRAEALQIPMPGAADELDVEPNPVPSLAIKPLLVDVDVSSGSLRPETRPHAFVILPFGKKKGSDGSLYDFNAIYSFVIKPALESAGFEPFRADEEATRGDILTDMFQELLLADLCIADLSIDNANVFYQLGIRHAFRKRGIVHVQAGRTYMPFDVFNVPTILYHITPEGVPDPSFLEKDISTLARTVRDTWASDISSVHSPIFNLLNSLMEPDHRSLRIPLATGFWREYNEWKERVTLAARQKRIGDILLLTEEIQNPLIKEEATRESGKMLSDMGKYELALVQFRRGLEINPSNLQLHREEAHTLNRLGKVNEAIRKTESILDSHPEDKETSAYLARLYKEKWMDSWKDVQDPEKRLQAASAASHLLVESFETYLRCYLADLNEVYPGVNAVTLGAILTHLADRFDDPDDPDPDMKQVREKQLPLRGALELLLEERAADEKVDYWTLISLAELRVLSSKSLSQVGRAYRKAAAASRENVFYLSSSLLQLEVLQALQIRPEFVQAGIDVLSEELKRTGTGVFREEEDAKAAKEKESAAAQEGMVFLFAGYMVDNPGKKSSQFPPEKEGKVRAAIEALLDKYKAGPSDLAVTTGLDAGSEMIFVEACVERGIPVQAYFPIPQGAYVGYFIQPCGEYWVERFYRLRGHALVRELYQPDQVGLPKYGDNVHERDNRWAFYSALGHGIDKLRLIAVWDGKGEYTRDLDAHLVKHMVELVRDAGGAVEQIDPMRLVEPSIRIKKSGNAAPI
jgi:tetratricopeptide (TPR) repeat protein